MIDRVNIEEFGQCKFVHEFFYVINIWLNSENTNLNEITSLILKDSLFSSTVIINTTNIINKIFNSYMEKSDNIEKETNKKKRWGMKWKEREIKILSIYSV